MPDDKNKDIIHYSIRPRLTAIKNKQMFYKKCFETLSKINLTDDQIIDSLFSLDALLINKLTDDADLEDKLSAVQAILAGSSSKSKYFKQFSKPEFKQVVKHYDMPDKESFLNSLKKI